MSEFDHATTVGRRRLLVAGLVLSGGALVAVRQRGDDTDTEAPPTTTTTRPRRGPDDVVILNTAISLERTLVRLFASLSERTAEIALPEAAVAIVALVDSHHQAVADALGQLVESLGVTPYDAPNALILATQVDPIVARAAAPNELIGAAHALERDATQFYVWACEHLSETRLRTEVMRIGSVTARHAAVLATIAELDDADPGPVPATLPFDDQALLPDVDP